MFERLSRAPTHSVGALWIRYVPMDATFVAYAIGAGLGGAVKRNRVRRRLRAAINQIELPPGAYLIGGRKDLLNASFEEISADLTAAVAKAYA